MIYAEKYRNSGRLTGRYENIRPAGDNWTEYDTEEEFYSDFEFDLHDAFHTPARPDYGCAICINEQWTQ